MPNPTAAMLIIGDEILSGRTREANLPHLAEQLAEHGIDLREVRIVADEAAAIADAVAALSAAWDHVFTSGGIGPTHDDITAESVARAMNTPIGVREDARALLEAHYTRTGGTLNDARLRMARVPDGATLIDNPISAAPGFTLGNVHVLAGVPEIFRAMVATLLPGMTGGAPLYSQSLRIERGEGDVAGPLSALTEEYPDLHFGSYPFHQQGVHGTNVVVRGTDVATVNSAMARLGDLAG